jgi:uncharacterized membrane protein
MAAAKGRRRTRGENAMSDQSSPQGITVVPQPRRDPLVRAVTIADIVEAMACGLRDFQAAPRFGLAFGAAYALGGVVIVACVVGAGWSYLAYPLAAGFALVGPFAAVGLYEVSRVLARGGKPTWGGILSVVLAQGRREIGWMAFVTLFVFIFWMYQVRLLVVLFLGFHATASLRDFLTLVTTTPEGILFLLIGNAVGAALALVLYSLTVVSFPLLLDRDVDFVTAMITSVRAVAKSPLPMISWAAIIVVELMLASMPFFLGLLIVLPILGHTTWHLYTRIVAPAET